MTKYVKNIYSLQVHGQEADIISQACNEHGIKVLKFTEPRGPMFHYLEPTNSTFGDQPHLRDPLAKKYLYLKDSDTYSLGDCRSTLSTRINFKPI